MTQPALSGGVHAIPLPHTRYCFGTLRHTQGVAIPSPSSPTGIAEPVPSTSEESLCWDSFRASLLAMTERRGLAMTGKVVGNDRGGIKAP